MTVSDGTLLAFAALGGLLDPDQSRVEVAPGVEMIAVEGDPVLHHPDEFRAKGFWGLVGSTAGWLIKAAAATNGR